MHGPFRCAICLAVLLALLMSMINPAKPLDDVIADVVQVVTTPPTDNKTSSETPAVDQAPYRDPDGIIRFVREVLGVNGEKPGDPNYLAPYQEDILRHLATHKRVAARGPHGLGKTTIAAWFTLWLVSVYDVDVKAVTTASAWRQLKEFLWPEIRKWAARADWSKLGLTVRRNRELLDLALDLEPRKAFAVASDNPALIEGAHATIIGYVFDEAKAIPNATWDAAEGAFSGAGGDTGLEAYALAISTPGSPSGRFYDIHSRKPGYSDWWVRHVTLDEAIDARRISREWADKRKEQWGESSAVYQNRVLGEFADSSEDSVIPLSWVEAANQRWYECGGKGTGKTGYGVDPARYGIDKTGIGRVVGNVCEFIQRHSKQSTMETVGKVIAAVHGDKQMPIAVDVIGIGAGVVDRLAEQGYRVMAVNVAESTRLTDKSGEQGFINLRSALWWMMREMLDPSGSMLLALPPDDDLTGDLTAPTYSYTSTGLIKVESKDDLRARIGRSTDSADTLALALYAVNHSGVGFAVVKEEDTSETVVERQEPECLETLGADAMDELERRLREVQRGRTEVEG